jgi:uncharacterized integral membrane protein (TIGR00698 family)
MKNNENKPKMSLVEKNLLGVRVTDLPQLFPGLAAASLLAWASIWLSDFIGKQLLGFSKSPISPVMLAIFLGILAKFAFQLPDIIIPGLTFSVKKILRLGIILLGIRLTIFDIFKLGAFGVPIVGVCIIGALIITTKINSKLNLPARLGTLIAIGTSICGVTAIVAAGPAIGADEEESSYAITVITIFGLFATIVYPYLANFIFAGDINQVGIFLGTAVHETAQVVGAGQIFADAFSTPKALDIAVITKLVRNVFMAFVIPFMAFNYARKTQEGSRKGEKTSFKKLFPIFIFGFLLMAVLRSFGDANINQNGLAFGFMDEGVWTQVISSIKHWAEICLVIALAGVGLMVDINSFKKLGIKPFLVGLGASAAVGVISFLTIKITGNFVTF